MPPTPSSHLRAPILVTFLGLAAAAALSQRMTAGGAEAVGFVATALILAGLEIALSFDNAVVNANRLDNMSALWRRRFLTWGILIAVFGMRIVFPLAIVCVAARIAPWAAVDVAVNDPARYAEIITAAHPSIAAFGGVFLMLVALSFFGQQSAQGAWLPGVEVLLRRLGRGHITPPLVALAVAAGFATLQPAGRQLEFLLAAGAGVAAFLALEALAQVLDRPAVSDSARAGLGGFLYLEMIDASFSFDGVIGAFALTTNLFLIAIGLGIGAMYVRAFTIILVEFRTLSRFIYLENGAFLSVFLLSAGLLLKSAVHLPELALGTVSVAIILAALVASLRAQEARVPGG
ncbi:DUF475 domain-containing protein [Pseudoruegeria sp. SHC-113]|uniref:DUF475 domain-containing protein n=1 Tax=Pseudoruegeria sp. SHC-113 TaxID=2855439 RepID=UPI0021BB8ADF|nr:DUF475 domain-containing protein [Pseudoruegeria sp. SHC-113]MCT8162166.1 DUF475 domain-containing protein [Pseudoruegeria sp. SHC-113]